MIVSSYAHDNTFTVHATETAIFIESHGKSVVITLLPEGARRMHRLLGQAIKQHEEIGTTDATKVSQPETSSTEEVANA